jgi:hypothetical protein
MLVNELIKELKRIVYELDSYDFPEDDNNCLNCKHGDTEHGVCNLFKASPPWKVIVSGCEAHEFESIIEPLPKCSEIVNVPIYDDDIPF